MTKKLALISRLLGNLFLVKMSKYGEWKNYNNYDICLNSDVLGVEKTAQLICEVVKEKQAKIVVTNN